MTLVKCIKEVHIFAVNDSVLIGTQAIIIRDTGKLWHVKLLDGEYKNYEVFVDPSSFEKLECQA